MWYLLPDLQHCQYISGAHSSYSVVCAAQTCDKEEEDSKEGNSARTPAIPVLMSLRDLKV